ncbi:MAG: helix-turn-helix transcriptional regulator [Clostridia bacterium]|nr:helix-turn-helix transcriptional regulator [Clostridia bacterium]
MEKLNISEMAKRIRALRNEKGVDQNTMAKDINVSNASISYWETAKQIPSAEVIYKMAKYFDVSADYILGIKED